MSFATKFDPQNLQKVARRELAVELFFSLHMWAEIQDPQTPHGHTQKQ